MKELPLRANRAKVSSADLSGRSEVTFRSTTANLPRTYIALMPNTMRPVLETGVVTVWVCTTVTPAPGLEEAAGAAELVGAGDAEPTGEGWVAALVLLALLQPVRASAPARMTTQHRRTGVL